MRPRGGNPRRGEPVAILFFDCATLYFETAVEDELRQHGFGKDGKHRDPQILLALMVTREGLPISYEAFPGATYEGHSLVPVLQDMQRRHQVERTVWVADRGMLSADNLDAMDTIGGECDARLTVNPEKIAEAERWDGLAGVITNLRDASVTEVMSHHHGLWQVEESCRITKHDLRARPIWHWNSDRIRAHTAIACMAFACVRHLAHRVAIQKRRMSPEVIRSALVHRQCSVLRCRQSGNRYVIPSKPAPAAERIYATMGLPLTITPYQLA